jgi:hypothetical protein
MARIPAFAASLLMVACASRPVEVAPAAETRYRFTPGDILVYRVASELECDMAGSHPKLLTAENEKPLSWIVNGDFENAVMTWDELKGFANLERRVRRIRSSSRVQVGEALEKSEFAWDRGGPLPPDGPPTPFLDRFVASMIAHPMKFLVDAEGRTTLANSENRRLVMRRGMMYWPIRAEESAWKSVESIAIPMLHDKVEIEFLNRVRQDVVRSGYRARLITATASLKIAPTNSGFHSLDALNYKVDGSADVEFDLTAGRLRRLSIDLMITFDGAGDLPDEEKGRVRGTVRYRETQSLVE